MSANSENRDRGLSLADNVREALRGGDLHRAIELADQALAAVSEDVSTAAIEVRIAAAQPKVLALRYMDRNFESWGVAGGVRALARTLPWGACRGRAEALALSAQEANLEQFSGSRPTTLFALRKRVLATLTLTGSSSPSLSSP
jgi:hypothetical protein